MGYFNELRVKYGTYIDISYISFFFLGVVLKSISDKKRKAKKKKFKSFS